MACEPVEDDPIQPCTLAHHSQQGDELFGRAGRDCAVPLAVFDLMQDAAVPAQTSEDLSRLSGCFMEVIKSVCPFRPLSAALEACAGR